jgi:LysM repeat protein
MQAWNMLAKSALVGGLVLSTAFGQLDPARREDAEAERLKILRAADQVDILQHQLEAQQKDLDASKSEISKLTATVNDLKAELARRKSETDSLRAAFEKAESNRAEERKVLLNEVSKLVSGGKPKEVKAPKETPPAHPETKPDENAKTEKGYTHTVEAGQSLWTIVQAYREQGVNVTIEDVRKANNLTKNETLQTGRKLFIPKK